MLYYVAATRAKHGCRSGIMVTGSHNPKDYNGFKMVLSGAAVYGEQIQGLKRRIEAEDYIVGKGRSAKMDIGAEYSARIVKGVQAGPPAEDRRRQRQRHSRRLLPGHPARARLRGDRHLSPRSMATSPTTIRTPRAPRTWKT